MSQQKKLEINERVRLFREKLKWSQERLGRELGVSGNYVYLIEKGDKVPGPSLLKLFESLENSPVYNSEAFREGSATFDPPADTMISHLGADTLIKSVQDLAKRLSTATDRERKFILGNLSEVIEELEGRELGTVKPNRVNSDPKDAATDAALDLAKRLEGK